MVLDSSAMPLPDNADRRVATRELSLPPLLSSAPDFALFLDFDGTLVDIAPSPDAIVVRDGLPEMLARLNDRLDGRLALISGRALDDLDRHLGAPDIAMAGSHGGEFRAARDGPVTALAAPLPDSVLAQIQALASDFGGLLVEAKPFSAAIHYRASPGAEAAVLAATKSLAELAGLQLKRGKMVAEVIMPGSDKGAAVGRFMELPRFAGSRPLFAGDDITDEDAFGAVLDHDGGGILVGPQRETAALWRLPGVAEVHGWLKAALA